MPWPWYAAPVIIITDRTMAEATTGEVITTAVTIMAIITDTTIEVITEGITTDDAPSSPPQNHQAVSEVFFLKKETVQFFGTVI